MGEDTILNNAFFAAGSAFLEETFGLTSDSEKEEDASEDTPVLLFDQKSGAFISSESEEADDDDWYIDNGEPESEEDAYSLVDLDDEDFVTLAGLRMDQHDDKGDESKVDWNSHFTG
jgi:hypothetical protein